MGRRKRSSVAEDVIELVALMPWWVGLVLAFVSYLYFHSVASKGPPVVAPGQVAHSVLPILWYSAAGVLQYIAPLLCAVGAGLSAFQRYKRKQEHSAVESRGTFAGVDRSSSPRGPRSDAGRREQRAAAPAAQSSIRRANAEQSPSCPKCSKPMVRRVARQGAAAGNAFWGCTDYPGCRGTRQIET